MDDGALDQEHKKATGNLSEGSSQEDFLDRGANMPLEQQWLSQQLLGKIKGSRGERSGGPRRRRS